MISRDKRQRRKVRLVTVVAGAMVLWAAVASSVAAQDADDPGRLTVTGPEPQGMTWTVLSRFGGDSNGDGQIDGLEEGVPEQLDVFPVLMEAPREACDLAGDATWSVDGHAQAPRRDPEPVGGVCEVLLSVDGEGEHVIDLRIDHSSASPEGSAWVANVVVDDRLVVALGDSVASGEGNPDDDGKWLDGPCHRSADAGFERATRRIAGSTPEISVTFVSLACSGARIDKGLLQPYGGVKPQAGTVYEPQVDRLGRLALRRRSPIGEPAVDAVLISVAANDVRFQEVVTACALPGDCRDANDATVFENLLGLPRGYKRLATGLAGAAPGSEVLVSEYFDPTRDEDGNFCEASVGLTTSDEAEWAYESLLRPLNLEVEIAAKRNGWRYVGGIASDFEAHGYCSESRWVQPLGKSIVVQGDHLGTLHPNVSGHKAIANNVAPELADSVGVPLPDEEEPGGEGLSTLEKVGLALFGLVALAALGFLGWLLWGTPVRDYPKTILTWALMLLGLVVLAIPVLLWRVLVLALPTNRMAPGPPRKDPTVKKTHFRRSPGQLALVGLALLGVAVLVVIAAGVIGGAILWVRFWSANLPVDQALDAVSRGELVATGTRGLALFVVVGLLGLIGAWMLDGAGNWGKATRAGLVTIAVIELVVAVLALGDYRLRQELEIFAGFILFALFAYFLVDRSLERATRKGEEAPRLEDGKPPSPSEVAQGEPKPILRGIWDQLRLLVGGNMLVKRLWPLRILLRCIPVVLLLLAVGSAVMADLNERLVLVLVPYLLAAVFFVAPGGVAWTATADTDPEREDVEALEPPRVALALAGVACVAILMIRDQAWLAAAAAIAIVLAFFCLIVARASGPRFAPYGLAILVSVPLFGASAVMLRGIDRPELQPVAAILDDGRAVCGTYVGESDGQLWVGHAHPSEVADERRPDARRGSIESFDSDQVASRSVGPLQPVARANAQALSLRAQLIQSEPPTERPVDVKTFTCAPSPEDVKPDPSPGRSLAERFQPELILDREDRFWPVSVQTVFAMEDRRAVACRQVRLDPDDDCVRLTTQGEFPWSGGDRQAIEFPAANDRVDEQADLMTDALASIDPDRTAREYFLAVPDPGEAPDPADPAPITLQYWFYYTFNYQPLFDAPDYGGFHEGDFESVAVLLSARTREPRFIRMSRHDKEGRVFPWGDEAIRKLGTHPVVFVAKGSHASYERCGRQYRPDQRKEIDDSVPCQDRKQLALAPESTPLTDLSRVSWACWRGLFGHQRGGFTEVKHLLNDAPLGPLWQQNFGGQRSEPCRGVEDPGRRDGPTEEVIKEKSGVPATLRRQAGRLEAQVDTCSDWTSVRTTGTYLVACDPKALKAYVDSGFEDPGDAGVRIEPIRSARSPGGAFSVPAVGGTSKGVYLDEWAITSQGPTTVTLFASCPHDRAILAAEFEDVQLQPGSVLRITDRDPAGWRLIREDGTRIGRPVRPDVVTEQFKLGEGTRLSCSRLGDE